MFGVNRKALVLLVAGYAVHVGALMGISGRFLVSVPVGVLTIVALAGLLLAIFAIWLELRALDEVQRGFALTASAVAFAGTATLSYLSSMPGLPSVINTNTLWAVALAIWLATYGVLQWRAR